MDLLKSLLPLVFPAILIAAALRDLASFTIPNWMPGLLLIAFFPAAWAVGLSLSDVGIAVGLGLAGLVIGFAVFVAGWLGGGDAKLVAASMPWVGLTGLPTFLLATAMAGGGLAIMLLWLRSGWLEPHLARGPAWVSRLATRGEGVPYGVAIAVGGLMAFPAAQISAAFLATF